MYIFRKKVLYSMLMLIIGIAMVSTQAIAQEGEAQLTGQVVDASTQEAVSGAQVTLQGEDQEATTDENGSFTFESLSPGSYTITASAEGYQDWEQEVEITEQGGAVQIELEPAARL